MVQLECSKRSRIRRYLTFPSYFDQIDHGWMMRFMEHRIADKRVLRLIRKWLKAGVLDEKGNRVPSDRGAAQGAVISPLLANIYLHYVLDLWTL